MKVLSFNFFLKFSYEIFIIFYLYIIIVDSIVFYFVFIVYIGPLLIAVFYSVNTESVTLSK